MTTIARRQTGRYSMSNGMSYPEEDYIRTRAEGGYRVVLGYAYPGGSRGVHDVATLAEAEAIYDCAQWVRDNP